MEFFEKPLAVFPDKMQTNSAGWEGNSSNRRYSSPVPFHPSIYSGPGSHAKAVCRISTAGAAGAKQTS